MNLDGATPVWYLAYGSNLRADRFLCYLAGGRPEGAGRTYVGCRDRTRFRDAVAVDRAARLVFAGTSMVWQGGIAHYVPDPQGRLVCRAYLITFEQFTDLVCQETRQQVGITLEFVPGADGSWRVAERGYETVLHLGELRGHPMMTLTSTRELTPASPTAPYLLTIDAGLRETVVWSDAERVQYLLAAEGVALGWSRDSLTALLDGDHLMGVKRP